MSVRPQKLGKSPGNGRSDDQGHENMAGEVRCTKHPNANQQTNQIKKGTFLEKELAFVAKINLLGFPSTNLANRSLVP